MIPFELDGVDTPERKQRFYYQYDKPLNSCENKEFFYGKK
jgi:endonuclease YncB( thermonuclease family)